MSFEYSTPASAMSAPLGASLQDPKIRNLEIMVRARYGVIYIPSPEERRVLDVLSTIARRHQLKLMRWSCIDGLVEHQSYRKGMLKPNENTRNPEEALRQVIAARDDATLFVFMDLHPYTQSPAVVRLLRDCAHWLRGNSSTLVLLSPRLHIPEDLEKEIAVADFPLPTQEEIARLVDSSYEAFRRNPKAMVDQFTPELRDAIIRACSGLTENEIDDALARSVSECGGLTPAVVESLIRIKQEAVRRTRCLEAIGAVESMANVGGLDVLKEWVRKRQKTFTQEARKFGIEYPKGVLTLGVPGGGKGLSARAIASEWRLPLLRLDMGSVFGGLVGESESNLREALRIAEAMAPCVLWIDEIEKGLSGVASSNQSDGGTTARVFGSLLTWLQEKTAPVFCYFTANDIRSLPPELLRKGRIDELFFIDLPTLEERKEILAIHLRKRGRDPANFDLDTLAEECEGFVGAEIEQGIKEALIDAFSEGRDLQTADIVTAFQRTVPMVKTQREKIEELLNFVEQGRAVRASSGPRVDLSDDFFLEPKIDVSRLHAGHGGGSDS